MTPLKNRQEQPDRPYTSGSGRDMSKTEARVRELEAALAAERARAENAEAELCAIGARPPVGTTNCAMSYAAQRAKEIENERHMREVQELRTKIFDARREAVAAEARVRELEAALRPFAGASRYIHRWPNEEMAAIWVHASSDESEQYELTVGDLRRAAAALARKEVQP